MKLKGERDGGLPGRSSEEALRMCIIKVHYIKFLKH